MEGGALKTIGKTYVWFMFSQWCSQMCKMFRKYENLKILESWKLGNNRKNYKNERGRIYCEKLKSEGTRKTWKH